MINAITRSYCNPTNARSSKGALAAEFVFGISLVALGILNQYSLGIHSLQGGMYACWVVGGIEVLWASKTLHYYSKYPSKISQKWVKQSNQQTVEIVDYNLAPKDCTKGGSYYIHSSITKEDSQKRNQFYVNLILACRHEAEQNKRTYMDGSKPLPAKVLFDSVNRLVMENNGNEAAFLNEPHHNDHPHVIFARAVLTELWKKYKDFRFLDEKGNLIVNNEVKQFVNEWTNIFLEIGTLRDHCATNKTDLFLGLYIKYINDDLDLAFAQLKTKLFLEVVKDFYDSDRDQKNGVNRAKPETYKDDKREMNSDQRFDGGELSATKNYYVQLASNLGLIVPPKTGYESYHIHLNFYEIIKEFLTALQFLT